MSEPPGFPLSSGFDYRPVDEVEGLRLSPEAQKRVMDKIESVQAARRHAMAHAHEYVIGGARPVEPQASEATK